MICYTWITVNSFGIYALLNEEATLLLSHHASSPSVFPSPVSQPLNFEIAGNFYAMEHHYMKMILIDGERCSWMQGGPGFEGLFCTSIMKLLFCMCSHLLTSLTKVMKARVHLALVFHLGMNMKVAYLFNLRSDWVFMRLLLWFCWLGWSRFHCGWKCSTRILASLNRSSGQWVFRGWLFIL